MNPIDLVKSYMTKGLTPKGIVKTVAGNNPIINNLIDMLEKGDTQGVESFAKNVFKERGLNLDDEMKKFKQALNIR